MGTFVALVIITLWFTSLAVLLKRGAGALGWPAIVAAVALRTYLTTGLFITAHDAMHGSVSRARWVNRAVGTLACLLFAGMSYRRLAKNHALHHAHPATERDPDYYGSSPRFVVWFATFMARYTTLWQLLGIAVTYNVLRLAYDDATLWLFWAGPSLLASLQLFFFGTYLPHRPPHDESLGPHRARTLPPRHLLAMLTCYFFGYHREHHERPATPWWLLHRAK